MFNFIPIWAWGILGAFVLGAAAGGGLVDDHWKGKYAKHLLADKAAVEKAVTEARADERKAAKLSETSGTKAAVADQKIQVQTRTIIKEVPKYVTVKQDAVGCVSYGLVRVLDAAVLGVDPAALELPAGKSNDACSPVEPSDLARSVVDNYGTSRQNATQLDELIADTKARIDIANGETP